MNIQQVMVTGPNQVELQERVIDESLRAGELLVRSEWTFISAGTELANYTGVEPDVFVPGSWCAYPWNSGYANVGTVLAVGAGVVRFRVGDRVFSRGSHASCVKVREADLVVPVPAELESDLAVATRMAGVGVSALVMADLRLHPWVVVFGLGMVGNLAAQAFGILGGRVIGVDPVASRRQLASACGLRWTVGGTAAEVRQAIGEITGGQMADITVEATGLTPVLLQALAATADVGQLLLLGTPRAPLEGNLTDAFKQIHLRYITVRGALEWCPPTYPPVSSQNGRTFDVPSLASKQQMIFDWVRDGQMRIAPLISHRLPPAQIKQAYEGLRRDSANYVGVAIDWR